MAKLNYTSIKPGFVFEHDGVKLMAEIVPSTYSCEGCYFNKDICESEYPCSSRISPKQIKSLIFKKVENVNWNHLSIIPPDEMVEVIDEKGNTGFAIPTYYPFKVGESVNGKKWSSPVIPCTPYWDGGWMIQCEGLEIPNVNNIVGWKKILK